MKGRTSRRRDSWLGPVPDLLDRALAGVARMPGVMQAEIGLIDGDELRGATLTGGATLELIRGLADESPLCAAAVHGRAAVAEDEDFAVAVPIRENGHTLGAVMATFGHLSGFEQAWLESLAETTALALENQTLRSKSDVAVREVVGVLAALIEGRDAYTESHCVHIAEGALAVGLRLGLDESRLERLTFGGLLHDIGKIAVPDAILAKPGPLSDDEFVRMQSHAAVGQEIIARISHLADVAPIVGQHHERFDGTGYPDGLATSAIIPEARILAVVDTFDAMTSTRPYRAALPWRVATQEIRNGSGTLFDPDVVTAFLEFIKGEEAQWVDNSPT